MKNWAGCLEIVFRIHWTQLFFIQKRMAGLLDYFRGKALVLINKGATPQDRNADLLIQQPIGQVLGSIRV